MSDGFRTVVRGHVMAIEPNPATVTTQLRIQVTGLVDAAEGSEAYCELTRPVAAPMLLRSTPKRKRKKRRAKK